MRFTSEKSPLLMMHAIRGILVVFSLIFIGIFGLWNEDSQILQDLDKYVERRFAQLHSNLSAEELYERTRHMSYQHKYYNTKRRATMGLYNKFIKEGKSAHALTLAKNWYESYPRDYHAHKYYVDALKQNNEPGFKVELEKFNRRFLNVMKANR